MHIYYAYENEMRDGAKKIIAILLIVLIVFGWYIMVFGLGKKVKPIKDKIQLGLDIKGGVYVVMEAKTNLKGEELRKLMNQTKEVINKRVDSMGISNADVRVEGTKRIRVELQGAKNADEAIKQIGKTAQLRFVLADGSTVLDGSAVKNATTGQAQKGGYAVNLEFNVKGAKAFEEGTKKAVSGSVVARDDIKKAGISNKSIIILLDNRIISSPVVNEVISGGKCEITGNFNKKSATQLAALIRGGALPAPLEEVTSSVQSAKIGLNAFEQSVKAGLIGIVIIFLIMLFGYRIMGIAANIALLLYVMIIIAVMAIMGSVLTLPGIAGIILSIGMAVDANVIIFSRIKEEIARGKTPRVAVQAGFKRAKSTVIDSQVTTLIAAIILYQIGTSAVKGFAWTLLIGIVASLFTAVVITQLYLSVFANSKIFSKKSFYGVKENGESTFKLKKQFKFVKHRKVFYVISAAVIIVGLGFGLIKGMNYGIDFTGGTMIQVDMGKKVESSKVEKVLKEHKIKGEVIYSGKNQKEVIIRTVTALNNEKRNSLISSLKEKFNLSDNSILGQELFGPTVGKELQGNAIKAVLLAALGMLIYIRWRFKEWKFGSSALMGVLHDVLILLSFYAIFRIAVNNPFIAGVLTVVGYSINDTIVIFDRIRENNHQMHGTQEEIIDTSINQTLSRSIMTTVTTLVVMIPMYVMTTSALREFVLPLMVGIGVGCLSSIFICSQLYYEFNNRKSKSKYQKLTEKKKKRNKYVKKEKDKAQV